MIAAYLLFMIIGVAVFFATGKFSLPVRIMVAFFVFLLPSIALTLWVVRTGDKPSPGAITVVPQSDQNSGKNDSEDN